jgi:serine/threonine-protein kinase SRK2
MCLTLLLTPDSTLALQLCDFAASKEIARTSTEEDEETGSALYVAPEVIMPPEDESVQVDGRAADLFACGVILYICVYGSHPFLRDSDSSSESEGVVEMFQRAMECDAEFPTTLPPLKQQQV